MSKRRVVVTGIGALTPVGKGAPDFWNGLVSGKSGTRPIDSFDISKFPTKFAAQIEDFDVSEYMNVKEARRMDRFCQYAMITADEAVTDSGLNLDEIDKNRVAVLIGSGIGGMQVFYDQAVQFYEKGQRAVSPFFIPMLIPDIAAGQVSIKYGFRGANLCAVSACATGSHNIGLAFDAIAHGQADYAVCGGAEAPVFGMGLAGFNSVRALSTRNDSPETASRPFDKTRDGFVLGEGAGMMMLETYESAVKRGARIYGEIVGYGFSADAHHITAPDPEGKGVVLALNSALDAAGITPTDIDHINMHGTSTPLGDIAETNSIKKVFGDHAYKINLNSTKSMTGHMLGAAGAAESIATVLAIYHGLIPPTINYEHPDPECDLDYTTNEAVARDITYGMNNAFGFGGHNTTLVFKKFKE
ncbi:beta-ketoacyl-ACP synthase II [Natronogracilivirga saccharolytica]|uniref:3-oxoacyl-[acyl-carrier-protein] synthase 2 n=1 Tax=Natronogracilivirga saccharolytica TaxID=2812953 RepID=A0A8J7RT49_9BACT|nr:beta-ketoacyl-ACP synthase II [Natronogracilivirga saccharolytica]MBP3192477.1 beta-ketoacyl-ACP synthase II [Natronogracilivirga saccharolytica]